MQPPTIVPPVILTPEIVAVARRWRDACVIQAPLWTHPLPQLVCKDEIVSHEDGQTRNVAFYLSTKFGAAAFACLPDAKDRGMQIAPDGYYSVHIERERQFNAKTLLAMLLHELTHVIDPCFVADTEAKQKWDAGSRSDSFCQYRLQSEQRAFTAMWMAELRDWITAHPSADMTFFISHAQKLSREFDGFVTFNMHLYRQILSHFFAMAAALDKEPWVSSP